MKALKYFTFSLISSICILVSCRTEETIAIDPPKENVIQVNSKVATLISRTALKDGSKDNIIDKANCLTINFPVTVFVNGEEKVIETEDDYEIIEDILDELDDDMDSVVIQYPITVLFNDYTIETINSDNELAEISKKCKGENEDDDDIECIDFIFPIKISSFNINSELTTIITIEKDKQLYAFIESIDDSSVVSINFPIEMMLSNNSFVAIESIDALEEILENEKDACDEDDDYDYNDDDCDACTIDALKDVFETKNDFRVNKLKRNGVSLEDNYENYLFSFSADGTIAVINAGNTYTGTWEASGAGNDLSLIINIPDLPDFNNSWIVHELKTKSNKIEIELKNEDNKLTFV